MRMDGITGCELTHGCHAVVVVVVAVAVDDDDDVVMVIA